MAEENEENAGEAKKSGSSGMIIIIILLILLILVGGGVAAFFLLNDSGKVAPQPQARVNMSAPPRTVSTRSTNLLTIGPMYPMKQFVVNLLSESGGRFLKVALDIELSDESLAAEIDKKKPAVRDIIIRTLSSKTFEEVSTMKGKERLKDEMVQKINQILADGQVMNVFFTDFVVQ